MSSATEFWAAVDRQIWSKDMSLTEQEQALRRLRAMYGYRSSFTCHHVHYHEVGCQVMGRTIIARGNSWDEAIAGLERKVNLSKVKSA